MSAGGRKKRSTEAATSRSWAMWKRTRLAASGAVSRARCSSMVAVRRSDSRAIASHTQPASDAPRRDSR